MGYAQRNLAGFLPSNFSVIGPSCESSMQLRPGLDPLSQYVNSADPNSLPDHITDTVNEGSGKIERNSEESCGTNHEQISGGFNPNDNNTQKILMDVKQPKSHSGLSSIPSPGSTSGVASSRGHKFGKEDKGLVEDGNSNSFHNQMKKELIITTVSGEQARSSYPSRKSAPEARRHLKILEMHQDCKDETDENHQPEREQDGGRWSSREGKGARL